MVLIFVLAVDFGGLSNHYCIPDQSPPPHPLSHLVSATSWLSPKPNGGASDLPKTLGTLQNRQNLMNTCRCTSVHMDSVLPGFVVGFLAL